MTSPSDLLLGIDGGGSKTRALVADRDGNLRGEAVAASSNYHGVGFARATEALHAAISGALECAGAARSDIVAACFGLAGVGGPADRALFADWIAAEGLAPRWSIVNDAELVLAALTESTWGIALISGTGSVCYGRGPEGQIARSGGWGYLVGDEGSGYNIAIRAIQLATQTADGRSFAHELLRTVLAYWKVERPEEMIGIIYDDQTTPHQIAALAPAVLALADQGDPYALRLLDGAAAALARQLEVVARKLGAERPPVAFGGGVLCATRALRELVVTKAPVEIGVTHIADNPALGALALARRLLDAPVG